MFGRDEMLKALKIAPMLVDECMFGLDDDGPDAGAHRTEISNALERA